MDNNDYQSNRESIAQGELDCNGRLDDGTIVLASVILLCGLPGSGKSQLAQKLKERINDNDEGGGCCDDVNTTEDSLGLHRHRHRALKEKEGRRFIHIEYDALEESLISDGTLDDDDAGHHRRKAWNEARKVAAARLQHEIESLAVVHASCTEHDEKPSNGPTTKGRSIIVMDDNFHLRGMRKQIHRILLPYRTAGVRVRFGILWMETPLDVCIERNRRRRRKRDRAVPDAVITKMNSSMELPRAAWEINNWMPVDETLPLERIVQFILECPELVDVPDDGPDLEQQAADRATTIHSQSHTVDRLLRSWVSQVAEFDKRLAQAANAARKQLILSLKSSSSSSSSGNVMDLTNGYGELRDAFLDLVLPTNDLRTELRDSLRV